MVCFPRPLLFSMKRFRLASFAAAALAFVLILPGSLLAAGNPNAKPGQLSQPNYEVVLEADVPITLRDGVVVMADIYRPKAEGRFPVLVNGTPYGKQMSTDLMLLTHKEIVPCGYALVVYDLRGRNK